MHRPTTIRDWQSERPTTRSLCPTTRPCPWVSCRYHLLIDATERGALVLNGGTPIVLRRGSSQTKVNAFNHEAIERLHTMIDTCAYDVAARDDQNNETVARLIGYTREGVRLLLDVAGNKLKRGLREFAPDDYVDDEE